MEVHPRQHASGEALRSLDFVLHAHQTRTKSNRSIPCVSFRSVFWFKFETSSVKHL